MDELISRLAALYAQAGITQLVVLAVTVIGIPLVAVQVLGVAVAGVFGFSALAWWLGRALPAQATPRWHAWHV